MINKDILNKFKIEISGSTLHILAMIFMFLDHLWASQANISFVFTCIGRLAFPIFAFLLVEGFLHTSNLKEYKKRLLITALISEIPFNLMAYGSIFFPFHQNTLFAHYIALCGLEKLDKAFKENKKYKVVFIILFTYLLAYLLFVDYFGAGILMVYVFYLFRNKDLQNRIMQLLFIYLINTILLKSVIIPINIFNMTLEIEQQSLATLSLIFIFLYNGKKGINNPKFKKFCYLFYPLHCFLLYLLAKF